jgi:3-methyladenine DNA glycosylase AlkC
MLIWAVVAVHPNFDRRVLAQHFDLASAQNDAQKSLKFLGTRITELERQVSALSSSLILAWSIIEHLLENTETIDDARACRQQLMQLQALKPNSRS